MATKKRVAFCGTRGIPAAYGGFETAVDEISKRMSENGTECIVFCRSTGGDNDSNMLDRRRLVYVKGSKNRKLDTFVSSIRTGLHLIKHRRDYDYVFWFNNANVFGILLTLLTRIPMAVNTDGLEWRRAKWSWPFKLFYFMSSLIISVLCKNLISDSLAIQDYYKKTFKKKTTFIPYGAPEVPLIDEDMKRVILQKYEVEENKFFLQITRFEPDNLPLDILQGYIRSRLGDEGYKFILIGLKDETPYALKLKELDGRDGVCVHKANYNSTELAVLRTSAFAYVHGNSVGGTNPALLEAMACCERVIAINSPFSLEVLGENGFLFSRENLPFVLKETLSQANQSEVMRKQLRRKYNWNAVSYSYLELSIKREVNYMKHISRQSTASRN